MKYVTTGERIGYERGKAEGKAEGQIEGKQEGEQQLILRLLQRRVGELSSQLQECIQSLSLNQLENLGEALLYFTTIEDLLNWLQTNQSAYNLFLCKGFVGFRSSTQPTRYWIVSKQCT
jgi:hypothetical protein